MNTKLVMLHHHKQYLNLFNLNVYKINVYSFQSYVTKVHTDKTIVEDEQKRHAAYAELRKKLHKNDRWIRRQMKKSNEENRMFSFK